MGKTKLMGPELEGKEPSQPQAWFCCQLVASPSSHWASLSPSDKWVQGHSKFSPRAV